MLPETWELDKIKYRRLCYEDYKLKEERNRLIRERLEDQKRFHQICKELEAKQTKRMIRMRELKKEQNAIMKKFRWVKTDQEQ